MSFSIDLPMYSDNLIKSVLVSSSVNGLMVGRWMDGFSLSLLEKRQRKEENCGKKSGLLVGGRFCQCGERTTDRLYRPKPRLLVVQLVGLGIANTRASQ